MNEELLEHLAQRVDHAARSGETLTMLTADHPELDIDTAYLIQRRSVARRLERGERLVGMKMGLTSTAKMQQMGVHDPIYGHLTDGMILPLGGKLSLTGLVHPRVEPEVAFTLSSDLSGPVTLEQAQAAIGAVHTAVEVIDSRYTDFKFTLIDVVADNTSACRYVLSEGVPVGDLDLGDLAIELRIGVRERLQGSSRAILDHPLNSLARLAAMLDQHGEGLSAGQTVLAGAATAAVYVEAGDHVEVTVEGLPSVDFRVAE